MEITFNQIGTIFTEFNTREGMPIQSNGAIGIKGRIELNPDLSLGLKDLMGFSHIILIYHFHKSKNFELETKPFLDTEKRGVFATRAPKRPNAIGISVVKLLAIKAHTVFIENVDILNGTPLLDIKPYISKFDMHKVEKQGWIENKIENLNTIKSDKRFINNK